MFALEKSADSVAILPLTAHEWENSRLDLPETALCWARLHDFSAKEGQVCLLPDARGGISRVLVGYSADEGKRWVLAALPRKLPAGHYHLECNWGGDEQTHAAIGWGLGHYRFVQFTKPDTLPKPVLYLPGHNRRVQAFVDAVALVRDLVNLLANHMMPQHLQETVKELADAYAARFTSIVGNALLEQHYPAIHAVGRASRHAPRLLSLEWGNRDWPTVTLVGKGVCFDTGGLDIKPSQYMRLMKKDMGGAAHALGLAKLIMQLELTVHLRVLIPAVDNAIGGDAFRPGDILATRAGKNIEVDNTDAEGRLILCDALYAAAEESPDLILDFATLTGAARVALGTEIPVFFCNNNKLCENLQAASADSGELIWNLPLHRPYFEQLKSQCADFANSGGSYAGAITAALFLNEFVTDDIPWAHFDIMAWNTRERAGRPIGGEAMGLFAVFQYLEAYFLTKTDLLSL